MKDRILVVRLAGGWDSLNAVVPHREDAYHRVRPTLALSSKDLLPIDDRFALHCALAPLVPFLREGTLGIVHAAGLPGQEQRSHFEAWDDADAGGVSASASGRPHGGWLARVLAERPGEAGGLRAVALMDGPAALLAGAPG
ncbi:MAG: transcriptional initiation protein Tat, partial [Acidobacteria bacterium]|nr:transcriptional initiation protein Tat [Acidobacteriota bacterium]